MATTRAARKAIRATSRVIAKPSPWSTIKLMKIVSLYLQDRIIRHPRNQYTLVSREDNESTSGLSASESSAPAESRQRRYSPRRGDPEPARKGQHHVCRTPTTALKMYLISIFPNFPWLSQVSQATLHYPQLLPKCQLLSVPYLYTLF